MKDIPIYASVSSFEAEHQIMSYLFLSDGTQQVYKLVQYVPIKVNDKTYYNLGLQEFDPDSKIWTDSINSNNNDMRPVFNTVLHTIPEFFKVKPNEMVFVSGSDNEDNEKFIKKCRESCRKKCGDLCKNANRRMTSYCYYVDKNFNVLTEEYVFKGLEYGGEEFKDYEVNAKYQAVIVYKKNNSIIFE